MSISHVAVFRNHELAYPLKPPFNPPLPYPEYPFQKSTVDETNQVYPAVRELFHHLKLDHKHFNTPQWNPLGAFIKRGQHVAIKPNFVQDVPADIANAVIVHGSVLRPVLDFCFKAVGGNGRITIIDGPNGLAHMDEILRLNGTLKMVRFLRREYRVPVQLVDLRDHYYEEEGLNTRTRRQLFGDPQGYVIVDLGVNSHLEPISQHTSSFRSHDIREKDPPLAHRFGVHKYSISKTLLSADFIINVAKLKTNVSCGPTLCLKNNVGITNRKNWLPHYRLGAYPYGDASPPIRTRFSISHFFDLGLRYAYQLGAFIPPLLGIASLIVGPTRRRRAAISGNVPTKAIDFGCWHQNDTIWRTVLDLNQILLYGDNEGRFHSAPQRGCFCIVDGIVAGEGEGPIWVTPRHAGVLLAASDPVAIDATAAQIMGFVPSQVKIISEASELRTRPLGTNELSKISVTSNVANPLESLHLQRPRGWVMNSG